MSYTATVYKVMIASPGDVPAERSIVRELLSEWNVVNADSKQVVLLPVGWETHSVPEMGGRPQAIINKQVLKGCDLLVGVFWTRIGTATGEFPSGTVEEIEEHIKADRPVMLYFSASPVVPDSIDPEQYRQLQDFRKSCQSRGLYESYSDIGEFRAKLYRQLQIKLNQDLYFQKQSASGEADELRDLPRAVQLSKDAAFLLKECAADPSAQILNVGYIGGHTVQVRGKNLVEENSERSRATWVGALEELELKGFVAATGPKREIFRMTREGFDAADRLP